MHLIVKQKGGYQAIPIKAADKWDFHKLTIGMREVRIIFRLHGRRYLLYHTRELTQKYPELKNPQLTLLCNEIIAATSEQITKQQQYIEFERVCKAAECRHLHHWRNLGLITPATLEQYYGHPIDPQTEILTTHVCVDLDDIVIMDHEPPVDCAQEELPY